MKVTFMVLHLIFVEGNRDVVAFTTKFASFFHEKQRLSLSASSTIPSNSDESKSSMAKTGSTGWPSDAFPMLTSSEEACPFPRFTTWDDLLEMTTRTGKPLSLLPRFVKFCEKHQYVANKFTQGQATHIPNLLQGGKATGPLAKTSTAGQIVRFAAAYPDILAQPRHDIVANVADNQDNKEGITKFQHDDLSWVVELQKKLPIILEEVQRVVPTLDEDTWTSLRTRRGQDWSDRTGWAHIALIDNFSFQPQNLAHFPETVRILDEIVGTDRRLGPRLAAIARQEAGTGIPEHCDYMNFMLTVHTALYGPEAGCGMVVNGVERDWVPGGDPIVMDTTFLHETYNRSDQDLYLLLVDFWHPDLSTDEIDALRIFLSVNSGV